MLLIFAHIWYAVLLDGTKLASALNKQCLTSSTFILKPLLPDVSPDISDGAFAQFRTKGISQCTAPCMHYYGLR